MYKSFKEQNRQSLDSSFNTPFGRPNTHKSSPAVPSEPLPKTIMETSLGLRDIQNPEMSGWATKMSHKKLMTDHRKYCLFHDHCLLWGMTPKDPTIGGCFNFLESKSNINSNMVDGETIRFLLSDRERLFKFGSSTKDWFSRIMKSIRIRETRGNIFDNGKLLFSSAAKIYGLEGSKWMDQGVASIRLLQHAQDQFVDTAIFCDNKTDNKHHHFLCRNKIVAKGKNAWILHCCYNMQKNFKVEVLALRFFSNADSEHFKEAFDNSFPRPGQSYVPDLPESKLHNHEAFEEKVPIDNLMVEPTNSMASSELSKRFSEISDNSIVTASARRKSQIDSDAEFARQLQNAEMQSVGQGGGAMYPSDDEDSLFYQQAYVPPKPIEQPVVEVAAELPQFQLEGKQDMSPSKFEAEGKRRWLIPDINEEVKHILTELAGVTEIIETQFIDPLDDITIHVLPQTLTKDLTSAELDSMIYVRMRELVVKAGGSPDMVPEYIPPAQTTLEFAPGKFGLSFSKAGRIESVVPNSQAEKLGVQKGWHIVQVNSSVFSILKFRKLDTTQNNVLTFNTEGVPRIPVAAQPAQTVHVPPVSVVTKKAPVIQSIIPPVPPSSSISYGGVQVVEPEEVIQPAMPPPAPVQSQPKAPSPSLSFDMKPLQSWDVLDVQDWLTSLKLDRYHQSFENMGVDGDMLESISDTFLTMNLNVNPIHVKKIKRSLETIKAASM